MIQKKPGGRTRVKAPQDSSPRKIRDTLHIVFQELQHVIEQTQHETRNSKAFSEDSEFSASARLEAARLGRRHLLAVHFRAGDQSPGRPGGVWLDVWGSALTITRSPSSAFSHPWGLCSPKLDYREKLVPLF